MILMSQDSETAFLGQTDLIQNFGESSMPTGLVAEAQLGYPRYHIWATKGENLMAPAMQARYPMSLHFQWRTNQLSQTNKKAIQLTTTRTICSWLH